MIIALYNQRGEVWYPGYSRAVANGKKARFPKCETEKGIVATFAGVIGAENQAERLFRIPPVTLRRGIALEVTIPEAE